MNPPLECAYGASNGDVDSLGGGGESARKTTLNGDPTPPEGNSNRPTVSEASSVRDGFEYQTPFLVQFGRI